jgi:Mg2+ and Co2+ transporter CorA
MASKYSLEKQMLQKIKRLEEITDAFFEEINYLKKELKNITEKILKRVEKDKISKIKKSI